MGLLGAPRGSSGLLGAPRGSRRGAGRGGAARTARAVRGYRRHLHRRKNTGRPLSQPRGLPEDFSERRENQLRRQPITPIAPITPPDRAARRTAESAEPMAQRPLSRDFPLRAAPTRCPACYLRWRQRVDASADKRVGESASRRVSESANQRVSRTADKAGGATAVTSAVISGLSERAPITRIA